jgi:ligand-binding sensor domain-containing protein
MIRRFLFLVGTAGIVLSACESEDMVESPPKDSWEIFTANGLGEKTVYSILQDQEGTVWAGTEGNGIYRFKNNEWTNMKASSSTFLDDWVYSLAMDGTGNIYVGSWDGISRYNGSSWTREYTSSQVLSACFFPATNEMYFGLAGTGFVIKSASGYEAWSFNDTSMNYVAALYADSREWLWFGTKHGIMRMNNNYKITKITKAEGLAEDFVYRFFEDRNKRLWIGFWGGTVVQWYENSSFNDAPLMSGFDDNYILSIGDDMFGNLWFGAISSGAFKYNGSIMEPFGINDGLCDNTIVTVFRDRNNTLWFGGLEGGITRLKQAVPINK